jgi:protein-L-isoaspartate(D-aspartate) O-methyltransferase
MATDLDDVRAAFAERLRQVADLHSAALVRAFATVRREHFVGPGPWKIVLPPDVTYRDTPDGNPRHIYDDVLVAIDASRGINNGQPCALARWLDTLGLAPGERFLHIGCGVGYYTAVAAEILSQGGRVFGIEIDAEFAERASRNLRGYTNVTVACGDGSRLVGDSYDAILVNAGATDVRKGWIDQLRTGGRLLVPLTTQIPGMNVGVGHMLLVTRHPRGYAAGFVSSVGIFHCSGARTQEGEKLLKQAYAGGGENAVRSFRREEHRPNAQCWFHRPGFCLSRLTLEECVSASNKPA